MLVQHPRVPVPVAMRLTRRDVRRVLMLVMDVVHVAMFMLERVMQMFVVMRLGEVQIDADPHQQRRAHQREGRRLAKQGERKGCTDKGSRRKVCAGARRSQVPKTQHKEDQADPVAEEADGGRGRERFESRRRRPSGAPARD